MSKYSFEERLEAVLRVVNDGMSCRASAKILGVTYSVVEKWVGLYKAHGSDALKNGGASYTGEFKTKVVQYMHANSLSYRATAAIFCIKNQSHVAKWERTYYEEGPEALYRDNRGQSRKMSSNKLKKTMNKETEEDLIAEVQRLRMENEYLKKLNALVQVRIARENGKEPPSSMN